MHSFRCPHLPFATTVSIFALSALNNNSILLESPLCASSRRLIDMATETAHEGYYLAPCGDAGIRYPSNASPEPHVCYNGHEDKRAMKESHCGGSQYHSWPTPASYPAYPSNDAKSFAPPPYCMPPHGVPPMSHPVPHLPFGPAAGHMVPPQPPMFGLHPSRTPTRCRTDVTDTSSSNCTPRDHYTSPEKHGSQKRYSRKHDAGPRFPVVKIPEAFKKQGQPSPAAWVNSRGFPLRPGKPDCKHYISKGWCAYGSLCKFNHPDNLHTTGMPYAMLPCVPGSQPMVMNAPWMGLPYQWNGPWNQQHQSAPVPPGYPAYMCHPCPAGPCSTESGNSPSSHVENERATDAESTAMYH